MFGLKKKRNKWFSELLDWCKKKGIKVTFCDSRRLKDYAAMNPEAADAIGFKKIKDNEILIDKTLPEGVQYHNLIHELVEQHYMEEGHSYWQAHLKALKAENLPVSRNRILRIRSRG